MFYWDWKIENRCFSTQSSFLIIGCVKVLLCSIMFFSLQCLFKCLLCIRGTENVKNITGSIEDSILQNLITILNRVITLSNLLRTIQRKWKIIFSLNYDLLPCGFFRCPMLNDGVIKFSKGRGAYKMVLTTCKIVNYHFGRYGLSNYHQQIR